MFSQFITTSSKNFNINNTPHKICFDARTGRVLAVKCEYVDKINNGEKSSLPTEVAESQLFLESKEENDRLVNLELEKFVKNSDRISGSSIIIMPTSQCNLGCSYCGQHHTSGNMVDRIEKAVIERVENRFIKIRDEGNLDSTLNVSWFGGEPLLGIKSIFRLSEKIEDLSNQYEVNWKSKMPTNGTLLDIEKFDLLYRKANLRQIEVTLDGPSWIHNQSRPMKNSRSKNFESILKNLSDISKADKFPDFFGSIRVNVHSENIDYIPELIKEVSKLEICKSKFMMNIVPVYDWGDEKAEGKIDRAAFSEWELEMCKLMEKLKVMHSLFPLKPRDSICSAVSKYSEVITTNGRIFSCTEEPLAPSLDPSRSVGHVLTLSPKQKRPNGKYDSWIEDGIKSEKSHCLKCKVLPLCGGSCPKQWHEGNIPCPPWKFNLDKRLDELGHRMGFDIYE